MLTSAFDYHLPPELIASEPLAERSASRMLVLHRARGEIEHRSFRDLAGLIREGDLLVLNDTRVMPARFFSSDGSREVLRLEAITPLRWRCMIRPGKKFRVGHSVSIGDATGTVTGILENGDRMIEWDRPVDEARHGHLALPHYMGREDRPSDRERYQTVFARQEGSIAAPTAGLHFTPEIVRSVPHVFVTLHVGVGTFQPVKTERVEDHVMHEEHYALSAESADAIRSAKRVIAVGTTACRVLETVFQKHGHVTADTGTTRLFIHPGFQFRVVNGLLTNFHLPKSSLLMLVCAFAGREPVMKAYAAAIEQRYRFYSYGDCMLIV